ncbi:hemolysin III family protein [Chelativorans sp. Marseille-P2723]|uniref:PAQR family membrane homeostasis protein TrhA n=1 Tax=Chelativorans sp. Marseille-P2723 TaxID=2709133 RepID=UPI0015707B1D|nr:hemolysin III family protein [Chelativorans sp. Marseille-P2723]
MDEIPWHYDRAESFADGVIHVIGVLLAVTGAAALLIVMAWGAETDIAIATSIYALTLVTTLSISALYNMWPVSPLKWRLRKYDHAAIYLLIAGTYTPFALRMDATGAWLLAWVWTVAAFGMVLKIAFPKRFARLAIPLYLGLGWSGIALVKTMLASLSPTVVWLLILGGAAYSVGVVFHLWRSLRFQNAIWHAFVLKGAIIHYSAVIAAV